jgi:uncharacterized protein
MADPAAKSASELPDTPRNRHLFGPGPKRILAIDGGGVRGIISLTFLAQIETILRVRTQRPELRLCDYFDLIGGTSTGAIIASGLALGYSVERLIDIYSSLSHEGFKKSTLGVGGVLAPKFKEEPLTRAIHDRVQDETLGSDKLLTGLCIVAKRLDSDSVWVMHNNPLGKYYGDDNRAKKSRGIPNKDFPLRNLLRASTAAPTYFEPQSIEVARDEDTGRQVKGLFVDGGVSPHNNPGLLMFMVATLKGYRICWPTGADRLMLVSVGNGSTSESPTHDQGRSMTTAFLGLKSLSSMMHDSSELNQALLQWMSRCPNPPRIDSEVGDLSGDQLGPEPLLHYVRYDVQLEAKWLLEKLELTYTAAQLAKIGQFDRPELLPEWLKIGRRSAERHVKEAHFPDVFDAIPEPVGASAASGRK